LGTQKVFSK